MPPPRAAGFTLIELVSVLVIAGLLATLGAPSFSAYLRRERVRVTLDRFTADVFRARSYAATNGVRVSVALNPSVGCASALVIRRAGGGAVVDSVPLSGWARHVCLTSNAPAPMIINSRGMLIGSPRKVRAVAGDQGDSISISIVGRIYRWN